MIGETVSHYRVLEKIGEGGMGEVYLAEDNSLKRKVALKFLPDYLQQDEVAQKRFLREAQSAAALDHPYICKIYEVSEVDGKDFIAMEYVKGQTLREKLLEGPVPLKQTLQIGMEIAEALEEAHKAGIAHRDLKPANIMLTSGGHVKVMDFGLAKKVVDEDGTEQDITSALTREGTTLGTIAYMSPEQLRGKPVDTRSDIFSFGIVLYELLSGIHPFRRPKQVETSGAILHEEPSPISRYTEDSSEVLQHTISKMLAKDPEERYQLVHEVWSNLKRLSEQFGSLSVVPALVRGKRSIWLGPGAVLILTVALVLWTWMSQRSPGSGNELIESVAVLPFFKASGNAEDEHLCYGIAANISARLTRLPGLRVIPTSELTRYLGKETAPSLAGDELDVRGVVTGRVSRQGNRLSVYVELTDTREQGLIWGKTYSVEKLDLITVDVEIAQRVVEGLRIELTKRERDQMVILGTKSRDAYDAYMRGRFWSNQGRLQEAIEYFKSAISEDPSYARVYLDLADLYYASGEYETAADTAGKVLLLENHAAEKHWAKGFLHFYNREWVEAGPEFSRAVELDASLRRVYFYELWMGNLKKAVRAISEWAERSDPLATPRQNQIAYLFYLARNYDLALKMVDRVKELDPSHQIDWIVEFSYVGKGMKQRAFAAFLARQGVLSKDEEQHYRQAFREHGLNGVYQLALRAVDQEKAGSYDLATLYALAGEKNQSFEMLSKIYEKPDFRPFVTDARFDSLHDQPRFAELLRKLNLPEEAIQRHLAAGTSD